MLFLLDPASEIIFPMGHERGRKGGATSARLGKSLHIPDSHNIFLSNLRGFSMISIKLASLITNGFNSFSQ